MGEKTQQPNDPAAAVQVVLDRHEYKAKGKKGANGSIRLSRKEEAEEERKKGDDADKKPEEKEIRRAMEHSDRQRMTLKEA